jgi:Kdo2-lipid IVA lauroyltransferase/acyltransferase
LSQSIIKFFIILAHLMPSPIYRFASQILARLLISINSRTVRVVMTNLTLCFPDMSQSSKQQLAYRYLTNHFSMSKQAACAWVGSQQQIESKFNNVVGKELIDTNKGLPTIIAVPHIGNWEFFWHWLQLNHEAISLYSPATFKPLDKLILNARKRFGGQPFDTSPKSLIRLIKKLKQGGVMMILPDQAPRLGSGIYSPFYRQPAYTMTMLHKLVEKSSAKLLMGSCIATEASDGYQINIEQPTFNPQGLSLESFNAELNKNIENIINRNPTQYLWGYKRFKRQPSGSEFYLDEIKRREKRQAKQARKSTS